MVEVEVLQRLDLRKVGRADPHRGALGLPIGDLPLQQGRQILLVGPVLVSGLVGSASSSQKAPMVGIFSTLVR
ncbi:hypothetical protein GCM10011578_058190 [Streptomyces fuscichromogenes]|uniref:Uncharacterized protein n=1 Tax=Streptomyces fuscichromogenes TaxID=1324013 RepID=A0A918CTY4_9ACTN|nr:hypothetical protein GCM10011578_058190 [Streptomyces fuscichromogenes]